MQVKSKKGAWALVGPVLGLVAVAIVLATGALILGAYQDQQVVDSAAYNVTGYGVSALLVIAGFLGIIAIGTVGFYLIRMMIGGFGKGAGGI